MSEEKIERLLAYYDYADMRFVDRQSRTSSAMGVDAFSVFCELGLNEDDNELMTIAMMEMSTNVSYSILQVETSNLKFAVECNRTWIGLTATLVLVKMHNIALAFHAERALRSYHEAMALTGEAAQKEAEARGRRQVTGPKMPGYGLWARIWGDIPRRPLEDRNGFSYNRCGAAIYWLRANCPVFDVSVSPAPADCAPELRLVSTKFGVPRVAPS